MKLYDMHTHSHFSKDAQRDTTIDNMCRSAIDAGVVCLAVTDHYDIGIDYKFDPLVRETEFLDAKEKYRDSIRLLRGIEVGQFVACPEEARAVIGTVPFDIVLGSLHVLKDGTDCYSLDYPAYSDSELLDYWKRYQDELLELASEGEFDILTHIRYPERYFNRAGRDGILRLQETACDVFRPVFKALIERGIGIEVNTSVVRKNGMPADPGVELLKLYREMGGVRVTVGSDAHRLCDLGADIGQAFAMLKQAGFDSITVFTQRKAEQITIPE